MHDGPASSRAPAHHGPAGRPTGSPLHCPPVGFPRWTERTQSCRVFPTKQQRDASPWQGEAGAQRRVRVGCVVDVGAKRCVAVIPWCTTVPCNPDAPVPPAPPRRATHRVAPTFPVGVGYALQHRLTRQQNDRLIARALLLVAGSPYGRAKFCDSNGSFTGTKRCRTRNCATVSAATLCPAAVQ